MTLYQIYEFLCSHQIPGFNSRGLDDLHYLKSETIPVDTFRNLLFPYRRQYKVEENDIEIIVRRLP